MFEFPFVIYIVLKEENSAGIPLQYPEDDIHFGG